MANEAKIEITINAELDEDQIAELCLRLHKTATTFVEELGIGDMTIVNVNHPSLT